LKIRAVLANLNCRYLDDELRQLRAPPATTCSERVGQSRWP